MAKTKKKEVQKQGLRPSQKAKAEKLRQKQATKAQQKASLSPSTECKPSVSSISPSTGEMSAELTERVKTSSSSSDVIARSVSNEAIHQTIHVKNAEGDPDTVAEILIQNKINYTPKVSVIMPVYNVEPYLRQCLDSVINQTLKEIEIICVDDGSTDASLDILKEYAEKDNRITVITQKNLYAGVARNAGLSQAKGKYLSFLDSDDFFELNMLEEMSKKADKDGSDVVICEFWAYDDQLHKDIWNKKNDEMFIKASPFEPQKFSHNLFSCSNPTPWTKMFRHQLFLKHELFFEKLERCNDMTCIFSALAVAEKITVINSLFVHYRTNQSNNLTSNRNKKVISFLYAISKLEGNLNRLNKLNTLREAFNTRILENWNWELSVCSQKEQNNIWMRAKKILSPNLYKVLYIPKISVIIPIYNTEKYIGQCLDSIVKQSLEDIEIICVDDGSTDGTMQILHQYAQKDERIKILQQNHKRAGAARNLGVRASKGKYIYFIDSDDWIDNNCLEKLYNKIEQENTDICIYGIKNFDEITQKEYTDSYKDMTCFKKQSQNICSYREIKDYIFRRFGAFFEIYKREFFIKNNLFFQENILIGEDVLTHIKSIILASKISFLDENLYYYRINRVGSAMTSSRNDETILDVFTYVNNVENFLVEVGVFDFLENNFINFVFEQFLYHFKRMTDNKYRKEFISRAKEYAQHLNILKLQDSEQVLKFQYEIKANIFATLKAISVIIPVYNVEKYLRECLDSVINQTLKEIEIICINDGSPDNSLEILKEYATKDRRIVIINQKNQGLSCSRNNAMKIAKGEYLFFLDSDDYLKLDTLNKLYNFATSNKLDMLSFSGENFIDGTDTFQENEYWNFDFLPKSFNCSNYTYQNCLNFLNKMPVSSCLTMYRNKFIKKHKIEFPHGLCYEDNVFYIKSFLSAQRCGVLNEKLYRRRIHESAITQNWDKHFGDYIKIVDIILSWIKVNKNDLYKTYKDIYIPSIQYKYHNFDSHTKNKYKNKLQRLLDKHNSSKLKETPILKIINSYIVFLFCKKKIHNLYIQFIKQNLSLYRIDIKNYGSEYNKLDIESDNGKITEPKFLTNSLGVGKKIEGSRLTNKLKIRIINNGKLKIDFRGPDNRHNNERYPIWIDYKSIKIDGKEILSEPVATWHDKPYHYEMSVADGQEITLEIEQQYHQYTERELENTILKLNSNSQYINDNMKMIIIQLRQTLPIIDEAIYKKKQLTSCLEKVMNTLTSYRLDIKNFGTETNALEVTVNKMSVSEPQWFTNTQGVGKMLQGNTLNNIVKLNAINDGNLRIDFRGQDKRFEGTRYPVWIDYKSIKIDGKEILSAPVSTWHDKPYRYEMSVKDGQEITLEIEQQYHEYTENELKDVILKLNANSDYVQNNIDNILEELKKKISIIDMETYQKHQIENAINKILSSLTSYRLDIKNFGTETNALEISADSMSVWFTNAQGTGKMLQGNTMNNTVKLKAINDGNLRIDFRGQDKRFEGTRYSVWIDYKSIKIDGKEILPMPVATWHDKPYRYEMPVKDGQEITLEIEQQYHQYSKDELKDTISKLNIISEEQLTDELIEAVYQKITQITEEQAT